MLNEETIGINKKLLDILGKDRGLFGRVYTWGQSKTGYEYIGYELSEDFIPILVAMSEVQKKNLIKIMSYFEIHSYPLKSILISIKPDEPLHSFFSETAWSHFMTVVMFGMLEVAVKITVCAEFDSRGYLKKHKSIKSFLETYLPENVKLDITERYKIKKSSFSGVIDHLWAEIRSGFIHEAGVESKGLEWGTLKGIGTKEDPITMITDVPMQELLQITWQAILNSYGYKGSIDLPRIGKNRD